MDPVSAALGIISSTIAIAQGINEGIAWFQDAKSLQEDCAELLGRAAIWCNILEQVKERAESLKEDPDYVSIKYINGTVFPIVSQKLSNAGAKLKIPKERSKVLSKRLLWHFRKPKYEELFNALEQYKSGISILFQIDENRAFKRERDGQAYSKTLKWLSAQNSYDRHAQLRRQVCPATGKWLLEDSPEFQSWKEGQCITLDCYGMSGAGKVCELVYRYISTIALISYQTYMSAMAIDCLRERTMNTNQAVLFLYLNYKEHDDQTVEKLMNNLLRQLIVHKRDRGMQASSFADLKHMCQKDQEEGLGPDPKEISNLLSKELQTLDRTYLIVDAMDECSDSVELRDRLYGFKKDRVSFWFTQRSTGNEGRHRISCAKCPKERLGVYYHCASCKGQNDAEFDICQECFDAHSHCNDASHVLVRFDEVRIEIKAQDKDIREYVTWELDHQLALGNRSIDSRFKDEVQSTSLLGDNCRNEPELPEKIKEAITEAAKGRFLQAKLYMETLKHQPSPQDILDAIANLPENFEDSYDELMKRIEDYSFQENGLAKKLLYWIVCTQRPLLWRELEQALAVKVGDDKFNPKRKVGEGHLLKLAAGLITIEQSSSTSRGGAVRLIHQSAQAYFEETRDRWFSSWRTDIAATTLTYLTFNVFAEPCRGPEKYSLFEERQQKNPFFAYAGSYWGFHVREEGSNAKEGCSADVKKLVLQIVRCQSRLDAMVQALYYLDSLRSNSWDVLKGIKPIHILAWFGLDDIIQELLVGQSESQVKDILNCQDNGQGRTALLYACKQGHASTVRELVRLGADANPPDKSQTSALLEVILLKRKGIDTLGALLQAEKLNINIVNPRNKNRTALMLASYYGVRELVELLLSAPEIHVNEQDDEGFNALSLAASKNRTEVMELLLNRRDIRKDVSDQNGGSPLFVAAANGAVEAVRVLLKHNVDILKKDCDGQTVLAQAVSKGSIVVIKEMLEQGVDLNERDPTGRTLLHDATISKKEDVARFLVKEGLDPNVRGDKGETPLHDAAFIGSIVMTRALLDMGADKILKDAWGRTPRTVAWEHLHLKVKNYLDDPGNSNEILEDEQRPLWSAALTGDVSLVKSAIARIEKPKEDYEPYHGNTALHLIISANKVATIEIMGLLLNAGLDPNKRNNYGQTPLHTAALQGDSEAIRLLIDHGANSEEPDRWYQTPLCIAQRASALEAAVVLLEAGAEIPDGFAYLQSFLFEAVKLGNFTVVKRLVKEGANVTLKDPNGATALQLAESTGREDVLKYLKRAYTDLRDGPPVAIPKATTFEAIPECSAGVDSMMDSRHKPSFLPIDKSPVVTVKSIQPFPPVRTHPIAGSVVTNVSKSLVAA